jgi:hypothetical protein
MFIAVTSPSNVPLDARPEQPARAQLILARQ